MRNHSSLILDGKKSASSTFTFQEDGTTSTASSSVVFNATVDRGVFDLSAKGIADTSGFVAVASGGASGTLKWWDTVRVVGPPGQQLQFDLKIFNSGNFEVLKTVGPFSSAGLYQEIMVVQGNQRVLLLCKSSGSTFNPTALPACSNESSGIITGTSGETFQIFAGLQFLVNAVSSTTSGNGMELASVVDEPSFDILIDPITPGASFTDASGATYSPGSSVATPEPNSAVLSGIGLLALIIILAARRRRDLYRAIIPFSNVTIPELVIKPNIGGDSLAHR